MKISHIEHLGIAVQSIEESLPYFTEVLGNMDRWRMNETAGRNVSLKVTYALNFGKKTDHSDVQINPIINSAIMKSL